jgi:hypothetical protein
MAWTDVGLAGGAARRELAADGADYGVGWRPLAAPLCHLRKIDSTLIVNDGEFSRFSNHIERNNIVLIF